MFNPNIRGWINYYGAYYKSALYPTLRHIDRILARWAHRSSSLYGGTGGDHGTGWIASRDANHACSLTGGCSRDAAEQWEPYEARASRTVLRAPGG